MGSGFVPQSPFLGGRWIRYIPLLKGTGFPGSLTPCKKPATLMCMTTELIDSVALSVPEYPDDPKRQAAYTRFVVNGESASDVMAGSGTSLSTFSRWRKEGNWDEKRADVLLTERRAAAYEVGVIAARSAQPIFKRYGDLQSKLLDKIEQKLDDLGVEAVYDEEGKLLVPAASSLDLLRLTQAVTACHNIGKHMLGVAGVESASDEDGKTQVAVQVNILNAVQETLDELPEV